MSDMEMRSYLMPHLRPQFMLPWQKVRSFATGHWIVAPWGAVWTQGASEEEGVGALMGVSEELGVM